jgi:hypothetical protein
MKLQTERYAENEGKVQVPLRSIGKLLGLCGDKIYSDLKSSKRFELDGVVSISAEPEVTPSAPISLRVYSYAGKHDYGKQYLTLIRINGDSLHDTFDGLIKLLEEKAKK